MLRLVPFTLCMVACLLGRSQSLQIIPKAGFNYHGISYIAKGDYRPDDFNPSVPALAASIGVDIKYSSQKLTHVLSLQSIALGPAYSFGAPFTFRGVRYELGLRSAHSADQALLSYGIERGSRGNSWIRGNYCLQGGIGFNKSKAVFDSTYTPDGFGMADDYRFREYILYYKRSGMGAFLSLKGGFSIYNKKNRPILNVQAFWHQGLLKMVEFDLQYRYGHYDDAESQRSERVRFNTRGTVFGAMLGVPIHILKK